MSVGNARSAVKAHLQNEQETGNLHDLPSVVVLNKIARLRRFMFAWLVDLWRHRQRLLSVPAASLCQIIAAQVCHSSRPSLICPHFNFVVHVYVSAIKRCRENLATRAIRDCQLEFINSKDSKQTKHI